MTKSGTSFANSIVVSFCRMVCRDIDNLNAEWELLTQCLGEQAEQIIGTRLTSGQKSKVLIELADSNMLWLPTSNGRLVNRTRT